MTKRNRNGTASILTGLEVEKIYQSFTCDRDKVIWAILCGTGERISAVLSLQVSDVYRSTQFSKTWDEITFRAATRKKRPDGTSETRQVPLTRKLRGELQQYEPPADGFLFPNPSKQSSISRQYYDRMFREATEKAGLDRMGFSLHSPRRTLATRLAAEGVPIATIQKITGHKSIQVLQKYIDVSEDQVRSALELL